MVAPSMLVSEFNRREIYMRARLSPREANSRRLQLPDSMPLGYTICLTERPRWVKCPELRAEHRRLFRRCFSWSPTDRLYWRDTAHGLKALVEVRLNGVLVAAAQAWTIGPSAGVENVMTDPEYWGKGLAKVAMRAIMQWLCKHAKVVTLWCKPEPAQLAIYRGVGFRRVKRSRSKSGIIVIPVTKSSQRYPRCEE